MGGCQPARDRGGVGRHLHDREGRPVTINALLAGLVPGLCLFAGYAFQTAGLRLAGAATAGFLTGLSVVMVAAGEALDARGVAGCGLILMGMILAQRPSVGPP